MTPILEVLQVLRCLLKCASIASRSLGWLSLRLITKSPPPSTMSRAISFSQPMASIVINESLSSICFNSSGIAVISLDFASVATWPKAIPSSLAQALTIEAHRVLLVHGTADTFCRRSQSAVSGRYCRSWLHVRASPESAGTPGAGPINSRRMQSREGIPLGSDRKFSSQSRRLSAQRWMAVGPSLPHKMPHTAITTICSQEMFPIPRMPRVGERLEVRTNCFDVHQVCCHASHPGRRQAGSTSDPRSRRCASTADTKM